ncbi:MAG: hypothetical protein HY043_12195 [Verrucomicrobia bacterium]|nr:hypothetical protein [Verrucomicrobiota bacterium]
MNSSIQLILAVLLLALNDSSLLATSTISFKFLNYSVLENELTLPVEVRRYPAENTTVTVGFSTRDGTAIAGEDYVAQFGTLTFAPGVGTQTITLSILDDCITEGTPGLSPKFETMSLILSSPSVGASISFKETTVSIVDDDFGIGFTGTEFLVYERASAANVNVTRPGLCHDETRDIVVQFATSDGTAKAGVDYSPVSGTIRFTPGETEKSFSVPILAPLQPQPLRTVNLSITNVTSGVALEISHAVLTITSNAPGGVIEFSDQLVEADEIHGGLAIIVKRSIPADRVANFFVEAVGGTATPELDYRGLFEQRQFAVGQDFMIIGFSAVDDGLPEDTETIQLQLRTDDPNVAIGAHSNLVLTIRNSGPALSLEGDIDHQATTIPDVSEADGLVSISVTRFGETNQPISVDFATTNGTAQAGVDFVGVTGTLNFAAGQRTNSIIVPLIDNGRVDDGPRSFNVVLRNPTEGVRIFAGEGSLVIQDNESPSGLDRSFQPAIQTHEATAIALQQDGKILVATYGTNLDCSCYQIQRLNPDGSVDANFQPPVLNGSVKSLALDASGRILAAGSFKAVLGTVTNSKPGLARFLSNGSLDTQFNPQINGIPHKILVRDNSDIYVLADCGPVLRLDDGGALTRTYQTTNCARTFVVLADGSLLIGASAGPSTNAPCLIKLDATGQPDSSFRVPSFSVPFGGCFPLPVALPDFCYPEVQEILVQADGKIFAAGKFTEVNGLLRSSLIRLNADGSIDPSFAPSPGVQAGVYEQSPFPASIAALTLDARGGVVIAGDFYSANGRASRSLARFRSDGTLAEAFGPLLNASIRAIQLLPDDTILVAGIFFNINGIACPGIAKLFGDSTTPNVEFAEPTFLVSEGSGVAAITLRRLGDTSGSVTVDYTTRDGSAVAGVDYQAVSGQLVFAPQETSKTFSVPILDNELSQSNRVLRLTLSSPTNTPRITKPTAELQILDDERAGSPDGTFHDIFTKRLDVSSSRIDPHGLTALPDGRIVVAGFFSKDVRNPWSWTTFERLNPDGSLDSTFQTETLPPGFFPSFISNHGQIFHYDFTRLFKVAADGIFDTNFVGFLPNFRIHSLDSQSDDSLVVIGANSPRRTSELELLRFKSDGRRDSTFKPARLSTFTLVDEAYILITRDDRIIVAGAQPIIQSPGSARTFRLLPDGKLDPTFTIKVQVNAGPSFEDAQGNIFLAGRFSDFKTTGTNLIGSLVRLQHDGSLDSEFVGGSGAKDQSGNAGGIWCMAQQPDGKYLVAGDFTVFHGVSRHRLARLNHDGTIDPTFDIGSGFATPTLLSGVEGNTYVSALAILPNGEILAGGSFTYFDGLPALGLARLHGDGRANFMSVSVQGDGATHLTAAVQPRRTYVFETSTDLMNWSPFSTNVAAGQLLEIQDARLPTETQRFYRGFRKVP